MDEVKNKIQDFRKRKKINQSEIAKHLGISQAAYAKIESGKTNISIDKLFLISDFLEVAIDELLGDSSITKISVSSEKEIKDLRVEIEELKKQIEQKDYFINKLRSDIERLQADEVYGVIDSLFGMLTYNELDIRKSKTEEEKDEIKARSAKYLIQIKKEIEYALQNEIITIEKTLDWLFVDPNFKKFIELDSETKSEYIKNCTNYINKFLPVKGEDIEQHIELKVITKWDPEKRKKALFDYAKFMDAKYPSNT